MASRSRFVIQNEIGRPMILNIEPEGTFFRLDAGQEVSVTDVYCSAPVTLMFTCEAGGDPVVSIWPGDGEVRVEKDGIDVLELNGPIPGSVGFQA
jgi:hypothetical protein